MDWWLLCRILLYSYKRRRAVAVVRTWTAPEPGARTHLLLRGVDGAVFQVAGFVRRSAAGEGHHRVEVQIPWETALSLAAWARRAVKEGGATVLHAYVAQVRGIALPPLRLLYEGYVALYGTFIRKVLSAPAGVYFLELRLGGVSLLIPAKYYKYESKDRRAGGDVGVFQLPIDVFRTLVEWGLHEPGADYDYVYARIWKPEGPLGRSINR